MSKIKVGVMMTSINAGGSNMLSALKKLEWDFEVLGKNYKWNGWPTRMLAYADFCDKQDPKCIIIFVDAYDALPVRSPLKFEELFTSFNVDILVGAEHFCWFNCRPLEKYWLEHSKINTHNNNYVQGGCVVGRAHALSKMYRWCLDNNYTDDQIGISNFIDNFPNNVALDHQNVISFHDNWGSTGILSINEETNQLHVNRNELNTNPYFIHFPGFLAWSSLPLLNVSKPTETKNYNFVGKHVLQDNFVLVGQVDSTAYSIGNIVGLVLLCLCFFICLILIFLIMRKYHPDNNVIFKRHHKVLKSTQ